MPPHSGAGGATGPATMHACFARSCQLLCLCTMAAYCAPRFRLLADLHAARLLAGACSLAAQQLQQSQHSWSSWHARAGHAASLSSPPPPGCHQRRHLSSSSSARAGADLEGDLIAPDVGLARIDGCVAPAAQERPPLGCRAACGDTTPCSAAMCLQGRRGRFQREQCAGRGRHHAVRWMPDSLQFGRPGQHPARHAGLPDLAHTRNALHSARLPCCLCRGRVHAVAGAAGVRRDAGQPVPAAPAAASPRLVAILEPRRRRALCTTAAGGGESARPSTAPIHPATCLAGRPSSAAALRALAADLLVLGTGRRSKQLAPELARQLHEMGVRVDAMDTVRDSARGLLSAGSSSQRLQARDCIWLQVGLLRAAAGQRQPSCPATWASTSTRVPCRRR